jgi:hypothetical protein
MGNSMLWAKILALALAGIGWHLTMAAMFCDLDPCGLVSGVLGAEMQTGQVAHFLRIMCETCLCAGAGINRRAGGRPGSPSLRRTPFAPQA